MGDVERDKRVDHVVDQLVQRQVLDLGPEDSLGFAQAPSETIGQRLGDGVLVREELVQRARRYASASGDRVGRSGLEADLGEDLSSHVKQLFDPLLAPRLAAARLTRRVLRGGGIS